MNSTEQSVEPSGPIWISDVESKEYLRGRKLEGDWTLTIDACMLTGEVFKQNSPVYEDATFLQKLSFFRIGTDCAALEWDPDLLHCRIWIRISEITEAEIMRKLNFLSHVFSKYIDLRNAKLSLEDEPNALVLVGICANRKCELNEVVSSVESHWQTSSTQRTKVPGVI